MGRILEATPAIAPYLASALLVAICLFGTGHVLLTKRDPRAAIGWIGLIWLSPLVGIVLYSLLGVNRIRRRARLLRAGQPRVGPPGAITGPTGAGSMPSSASVGHLDALARLIGNATGKPLTEGNEVVPLADGDQAYPAMLAAIDGAARSVSLSTYIFNDDPAGASFVDALSRAVGRGVAVRVLVDGLGARYDWPTIMRRLRRAAIPAATFLPTLTPGWFPYLNLRNHRKILVVDGRVGFTGGINIDAAYCHGPAGRLPARDLHFRVRGPVVADLQLVFADDWAFGTDERLVGPEWFPDLGPVGEVRARGVADGPDEDRDKLLVAILGALACARSSVAIVTPYFLPESELISALAIAAMRGVQVDILLPRQNNLALVNWAATGTVEHLVERGCRIWSSRPPFDHTKLMVVDGAWAFLGSANWDPRSLRLNFEFNLECYSHPLAAVLEALVRDKIRLSEPITLEAIRGRGLPIRLRDGLARLLSPYL